VAAVMFDRSGKHQMRCDGMGHFSAIPLDSANMID
jgi:hypothetical protein